MEQASRQVSVVIPMMNEAENVAPLIGRIREACAAVENALRTTARMVSVRFIEIVLYGFG